MVYKIKFISFYFILLTHYSFGQNFDDLVVEAWSNNRMLKAKEFRLESAISDWKEAKALFGPSVNSQIQYTAAIGGRSIDLPIGDLLNPVYSTLNQLTQSSSFLQIENTAIDFLPNNFYDAKIRLSQPIYYPDLYIHRDVKSITVNGYELEIKAFKRMVTKEVMDSYFQYMMAHEAINILRSADTLLLEAKRVTESLIKNGMATPLALSRIESQSVTIQSSIIEALGMEKNAEAAMRFVLGVDERKDINFVSLPALPDTTFINTNEREEIQQILNSNNYILKGLSKEKQFYKPRIGAFMDLGSQDFNFGFKPYAFGGIQLELQIFDHKRHNHRINSLSSQLKANNNILDHSRNQIKLQQEVSYKNLTVAVKQAVLLKSRIDLTRKVFKDALRRYREGNGQYLEVIDAQNQVTQIEVQYNLARLKSWQKWSEYLYVSAAYPIK